MENWEFLLQKQGDKSWLPLESPTVEILEGQYRLAARTKFADALVSIQLRYFPNSESIQKPILQRITKRVNPEGLLIVMPYTDFSPGTWRIECSEPLNHPEQKESPHIVWIASIELEVQSISAEIAGDWHLNLNLPNLDASDDLQNHGLEPNTPSPEFKGNSGIDTADIEAIADQSKLALPEFNSSALDLALPVETQSLAIFNELPPEPEVTEVIKPLALPYNLIALNQSQYLVTEAQMPFLAGKSYLPGELEVVLKNPQDLETVMHARFPLVASGDLSEPINFSFELRVPVQSSQVMIGEVRLHPSVDIEALDTQPHICYQPISLTYQSQDILAEVAQEITNASQLQSDPFDASTMTSSVAQADSAQNLSNLKLPQLPLEASPIKHASPPKETKFTNLTKSPELPIIAPLSGLPSQLAESDRDPDENTSELISEPNYEILAATQANLAETTASELLDEFEDISAQEEDKPKLTLQSPQIGDRFLDKLQAISKEFVNERLVNQQVSEFIDAEVEKLESDIDKSLALEELDNEFEQILRADEGWVGLEPEAETVSPERLLNKDNREENPTLYEQESTVSDALLEVFGASQVIDRSSVNSSGVWPTLGTNEPVPLPVLEIPEGEAISGVTFPILIKLPAIASRLFVKFWVKDCQTRNIIDGPRWLVDFAREPDADFLTVSTPITLPLGTMEVAFEAIAVEMQTQRESRKTSTSRTVTLPNLAQDNDVDFDPP